MVAGPSIVKPPNAKEEGGMQDLTRGTIWRNGFGVGKGGYEYALLLGIVMFSVALRVGGPYSPDLIGRQL